MIKAVLFDFDGTLVNTNDVIISSFQYTYEYYTGKKAAVEKITSFFGEILRTTMEREFPMVTPEEAMETYRTYQNEHANKLVKIFPGIKEMLDELVSRGLKIAVVTSRTKESTLYYMNLFGLEEYFDVIVSCDDTDSHKPQPGPILLAMEKLAVGKDEAIMIGDGMFDIGCANNAGVKSVLVGWRITGSSQDEKAGYRQDYEINEPGELVKLLDRLC